VVPVLYVDPQSPYAYLAASRAASVLGVAPRLEVVLLGALMQRRGHGSWAHTAERARHVEEVERRAGAYGLPPVAWPPTWPAWSAAPARAAVWAAQGGVLEPYLTAYWRRVFAEGAEPADGATLAGAAAEAGLDPGRLPAAIADPGLKAALREATDAAWTRGVRTIPTLDHDGALHVGDEALDGLRREI
jgi:2-hydroxychromene-2-carboxylate isomerase